MSLCLSPLFIIIRNVSDFWMNVVLCQGRLFGMSEVYYKFHTQKRTSRHERGNTSVSAGTTSGECLASVPTSRHRSPGAERRRERKRSMVFLEMTGEGHRQSDQHWIYFRGNTRENFLWLSHRILCNLTCNFVVRLNSQRVVYPQVLLNCSRKHVSGR